MSYGVRRLLLSTLCLAATAALVLLGTLPASAHGFSTTVHVDLTSSGQHHIRTELGLEYDLLVVSVADAENDDELFQQGDAAFKDGDDAEQAAALDAHADSVLRYVNERFTIAAGGETCVPTQVGDIGITQTEGVPYAVVVLDQRCDSSDGAHEVTSTLFGDDEGYVKDAKTIVTYDVDTQHGSAALDGEHPSFSTEQSTGERFWEFFRLGAEHLLTGIDHILFLLALIAGSRRLREIVLTATTFTLAHSVTFMLAALGLVSVSGRIVEPIIALSIVGVAGWHLWRLWREGEKATELDTSTGLFGLDRAGWIRLGVVFAFGLVHGLGFAGALGIDEPLSWTLLWSLLVFNVGIEAVQLGIIVLVFPPLVLLRRKAPLAGMWVTGILAAGVAAMGLIWFVQRVSGG